MPVTKIASFKVLIKEDLKNINRLDIMKKIKSVRYSTFSMGNSLDVKAVDLSVPERKILDQVLSEYKSGSWNSMEEIYEYNKNSNKPRTAKYVGFQNDFSEESKNKVKAKLKERGIEDNETAYEKMNCCYDDLVWKELNKLEEI